MNKWATIAIICVMVGTQESGAAKPSRETESRSLNILLFLVDDMRLMDTSVTMLKASWITAPDFNPGYAIG